MSEFKLYAVFGSPIAHSKSPLMFNHCFDVAHIPAHYLQVIADSADEVLNIAAMLDLAGFNVTSPFKESLLSAINSLDRQAEILQAVNTVIREDGLLKGFNTDVDGVLGAFENHNINLFQKRVTVLGAGGAAKAACFAMKNAGAFVTIINRTYEKAEIIAQQLECDQAPLKNLEQQLVNTDVLISCLSQGINLMQDKMLYPDLLVLDANYHNSNLVEQAIDTGCTVINGSLWLFNQAVKSFEKYFNTPVDLQLFEEALKHEESEKNNIALIGMMGTGKSSVGKKLAKLLKMDFVDIDREIEIVENKSIRKIFDECGEEYFRELEKTIIQKVIKLENTVIACGGGAVNDDSNLANIKSSAKVVWLLASTAKIISRLKSDSTRPLLHGTELKKRLKLLYKQRKNNYAVCSDLVLDTSYRNSDTCAKRLADELD